MYAACRLARAELLRRLKASVARDRASSISRGDSSARGSRDDLGRNSQGTYVVNGADVGNVLAFCAPDPSLNVTKLLKP